MDTTLLIGANHVIRVAALKAVNHYSAHITEDLLTGMKLHSKGWKSVYVPEVLAIGEGPTTWKSYFNQQKRWAYGCMHILFKHSFGLYRSMTMRRAAYYFCIQQHYFTGVAMLLGVFTLSLYFLLGIQSVSLDLMNFIGAYGSLLIVVAAVDYWLQGFNIRPREEKGPMWAGMYIGIVVWPIFLMAFFALFKRKKLAYKVTPKGKGVSDKTVRISLFLPHICLSTILLGDLVLGIYKHREAPIMVFWALVGGLSIIAIFVLPFLSDFFSKRKSESSA